MKKYKKPSKSTKECIEAGGKFTLSSRDYTPKRRYSEKYVYSGFPMPMEKGKNVKC